MSTRSEWKERSLATGEDIKEHDIISMTSGISIMSLEPTRHSIDRSMSLDGKVIGCKTRIVSEQTYEDKFIKNITMEKCYQVTSTNPSGTYIPINIYLEGYNRYEKRRISIKDILEN